MTELVLEVKYKEEENNACNAEKRRKIREKSAGKKRKSWHSRRCRKESKTDMVWFAWQRCERPSNRLTSDSCYNKQRGSCKTSELSILIFVYSVCASSRSVRAQQSNEMQCRHLRLFQSDCCLSRELYSPRNSPQLAGIGRELIYFTFLSSTPEGRCDLLLFGRLVRATIRLSSILYSSKQLQTGLCNSFFLCVCVFLKWCTLPCLVLHTQ